MSHHTVTTTPPATTATSPTTSTTAPDAHSEYENEPVPPSRRRSLLSVTSVWAGFPLVITSSLSGATIVQGLGFGPGVLAILAGCLLLFGYVGALSVLAARTGTNFSLQASATFGRLGYVISSGLLSTLVLGWFAVQSALVGSSMAESFDVNVPMISIFAGLLFTGLTLLGIRALSIIGMVSGPLFLVFGVIAIIAGTANGADVFSYEGGGAATAMSFGAAITLVFALFADSGTMTADFTRWAKTPRHALIATASAFPVGHFITMLFGAVLAAAAQSADASIFSTVVGIGGLFPAIAIILLVLNLASVCTHCLYNSAIGWAFITKGHMRVLTLVLGLIGTVVAGLGVWAYFVDWLNLLGIIVPPIGAIIITDQLIMRRRRPTAKAFRWQPFAAWAIGSATALVANELAPGLSNVIVGLVVAALAYSVITRLVRERDEVTA
ncbi:cytosine permease [Citricoccus sp. GCM10030269]|uniref:cytosine permease n=1 Tax=Citricoccus sp. GCM10030269 TaxID=3273388 RepID=UPI003606A3C1